MLSKLFKSDIAKLNKALQKEDLKGFREILNRIDDTDLSAEHAQLVEASINASASDFLEALLQKQPITSSNTLLSYGLSSCSTEQPTKTLRVLLKEGLKRISPDQLNQLSLFIVGTRENDRMALLSLLTQYDCDLNKARDAIAIAIKEEDRALIKFLIESGVTLSDHQLAEASKDFQNYASRIIADKTLRDSWL